MNTFYALFADHTASHQEKSLKRAAAEPRGIISQRDVKTHPRDSDVADETTISENLSGKKALEKHSTKTSKLTSGPVYPENLASLLSRLSGDHNLSVNQLFL